MKRLLFEEAGNGAADGGSGGGGGSGDGSSSQGNANNGGSGSGEGQGGSGSPTLLSGKGNGPSGDSGSGAATPLANGFEATPPVGTQGPWYANLYGADGKLDKKAFDRLPDHLKGYKDTFAKYDSVEALLGGFANASMLAGRKGLAPLPENAPPEAKAERAALLRQINGTPEKPDGYEFKPPADYPKEYWNDTYAQGVQAILHKHNAPPALAKELLAHDVAIARTNLATRQKQENETKEAYVREQHQKLRKEFGGEFDTKVDLAKRAARTFGLNVEDETLGNNADVIIALARVGATISEDRLVSSDGKAGDGMTDRQKARDIVTNSGNPMHKAYHDPEDPGHEEALRTVEMFNKRAAASKKK